MKNIITLAQELGVPEEHVIPYGWDKAKISSSFIKSLPKYDKGKLVLVTAITPTKAGEGKTTTTIGLHDGLRAIGVNSLACLREPSLGPCFGIKGGAVGALKSTIVPSDDINLHFTGDFHALTSTINLIAAVIDNHIYQGNELHIDPKRIVWPRALDMNDRALRQVTVMQGDPKGTPHKSEFVITVASELMAIMCIASDEEDFIHRVNGIIVAYTEEGVPIYLHEFNIGGAIMKLMWNALQPNLVQTLEENPVLVHGGPFANIAHGCNSVIATKLAMKLADIVVTEAGFGADLGAEKFLDIKCQSAGLMPSAIVLVATVRALKLHGGVEFEMLEKENLEALQAGLPNLERHMKNMLKYNVPVIVAINRFPSDTDEEVELVKKWCNAQHAPVAVNTAALHGSKGAIGLAGTLMRTLEEADISQHYVPLYQFDEPVKEKIEKICKEIYGAKAVKYSKLANEQIEQYINMGYEKLPICMAKTPNSFTDDPKVLGAPEDFTITIREVRLSAGAGFIIPLTGSILTMPGLPKVPRAVGMTNV